MIMPIAYRYFSVRELTCSCGCGLWDMNYGFMDKLIKMRRELNFPFYLSSAFRCPTYNNRVSSTGLTGPHTTGHSVDISAYGSWAYQLIGNAAKYGMTGIGVSQRGAWNERFIHLDDLTDQDGCPRPWPWSYL